MQFTEAEAKKKICVILCSLRIVSVVVTYHVRDDVSVTLHDLGSDENSVCLNKWFMRFSCYLFISLSPIYSLTHVRCKRQMCAQCVELGALLRHLTLFHR